MGTLDAVIVGAPRSGTYWMVEILAKHFNLVCPSETHFIPIFNRYKFLYGNLERAENRFRMLGDILAFIQLWTPRSGDTPEYRNSIRRHSLLIIYDNNLSEQIVANSGCYESLVTAMFVSFREQKNAAGVGDKSAHFLPKFTDKTLSILGPNTKVIHLVRDGRDVATSWQKQWFGPKNKSSAALLWALHVSKYEKWGEDNPNRYHRVKYEDLALSYESELKKLSYFLGTKFKLNFAPKSTTDQKLDISSALSETESHAKMISLDVTQNIMKWKTSSSSTVKNFESIAGKALAELSYELSVPETNSGIYKLSGIFGIAFSKHYYTVVLKNNLPLFIRILKIVRLPPEKFLNRKFEGIWKNAINVRATLERRQDE